ncbi:hypothetical protein [Streptomyces sp. KL116D]|uniref:hypothetical protein n=1 Tax=Streptomyces sp. KL116D TaxID=3045152 RepID=UPI003555DD79
MPFLEDGTPVDIILNPLGVPSRMNPGQSWRSTSAGSPARAGTSPARDEWAQRLQAIGADQVQPRTNVATPVFDGA